jgi:transketolase
MGEAVGRGQALVAAWEERVDRYAADYPAEAAELRRRLAGTLREGWDTGLKTYAVGEDFATRQVSQASIQALAGPVPELFGGAADLSESNLTDIKGGSDFTADEAGRNLRFGVREHAMGGVGNGIAYHGGFIPYVATFLQFSDYMRGSVRLAALSGIHIIYVWTHDSVGLGEDGPTHQPVEHYAALRAIPNLWFIRPGDANEASAAWRVAVERQDGPVALALTRQKLTTYAETADTATEGVRRGGYVVRESSAGAGGIDLILVATGSELGLAMEASTRLEAEGTRTRVVSLPCWEAFDLQDRSYRDAVLPPAVRRRLTIESGIGQGWERWAGDEGAIMSIEHFGASAPGATIFEHFGFIVDHVADVARGVVRGDVRGRVPTVDPGHQPAGLHLGHR